MHLNAQDKMHLFNDCIVHFGIACIPFFQVILFMFSSNFFCYPFTCFCYMYNVYSRHETALEVSKFFQNIYTVIYHAFQIKWGFNGRSFYKSFRWFYFFCFDCRWPLMRVEHFQPLGRKMPLNFLPK